MEKKQFAWGDTVRIVPGAPERFKPGDLGEVCSIGTIETEKTSRDFGEPLGSTFYTIEFGDGTLLEIPERYLELFVDTV